MKTITKLVLLSGSLALATPFTTSALAAPTHPHRPPGRMMLPGKPALQHPARKLDLTAEQKAEMKSSRSATADALKAVRSDDTLSRKEKREKAQDLLKSARAQIREELTPERKARMEKRAEKMAGRRPKPAPAE